MLVSFRQKPSQRDSQLIKQGEMLMGLDFSYNYLMEKYTVKKLSKFNDSRNILNAPLWITVRAFERLDETLYFIDDVSYAYT